MTRIPATFFLLSLCFKATMIFDFKTQTWKKVFLGLCAKWGWRLAVGGWGSRVLNKKHGMLTKKRNFAQKYNCSKLPKKLNKHNFYFSLYGVLNLRDGWVGSDLGQSPLKKCFWRLHYANSESRILALSSHSVVSDKEWHTSEKGKLQIESKSSEGQLQKVHDNSIFHLLHN